MTEITPDQAQALAGFLASIRPAAAPWDTPGIVAALGKARTRADAPELAIAAIRAAVDSANRTPAVIALDGAHWREPCATTGKRSGEHLHPPRADEACPAHPGRYRDHCGLCRVEAYGPAPEPLPGAAVTDVRAALQSTGTNR